LLGDGAAATERGIGKADDERLLNAAKDPANWPTIGGTYAETRFSPLDKINVDTVKDLKLAWYGDFDTTRGQEATPLEIDGVVYTSTAWSKVYAYDAKTGRQIWEFDPEVEGKRARMRAATSSIAVSPPMMGQSMSAPSTGG
jgi:quinohemoprotein ethanol dehydrogenase